MCVRRPTIRQEFSSAQIEGVRLQPKRSSAGICRSHLGLAHFIRVVKILSYCILLLRCRFLLRIDLGLGKAEALLIVVAQALARWKSQLVSMRFIYHSDAVRIKLCW